MKKTREQRLLRDLTIAYVLCELRLGSRDLLGPSRSDKHTARARQLSMYLMNTFFNIPPSEVAPLFNRERTTVTHALHLIEDIRASLNGKSAYNG